MANIKITDLDAYADPATTDVLPIVDVTNDETKKVSIADLMENAGSGTEGLPGIAFGADPDTGIYRPGDDQLAISTGGTQRILIDDSGVVTIAGDLTVNGTTTTVNSTTLTVDDKNIELGSVASPSDTTADGGGLTLKGASDKTLNWVNSTDSWTSSENVDLASGKTYKINGTDVLSGSTLGSGVTGSSLTSVGTITTGVWNGTALTADAIGADAINGDKIADDSIDSEHYVDGSIDGVHLSADCVDGTKIADDSIDSEHYVDGSIDNAHVSASAAIAGTKIDPDFGSQNVLTTGSVGVGIATPGAPLDVRLGATGTIAEFRGNETDLLHIDGDSDQITFDARNVSALAFEMQGSEAVRIDSDGRLLVGTNVDVGGDTDSKLQLVSTGNPKFVIARNDTSISSGQVIGNILWRGNDASGTYQTCAAINAVADGDHDTGDKPTRLEFSTTADGGSSPTERMRISANGNLAVDTNTLFVDAVNNRVGIGTETPQESLHATGNIRFGDTAPAELYTNSAELRIGVDRNNDNDASDITFYINNSDRARIDSDGRLLVGNNTALTKGGYAQYAKITSYGSTSSPGPGAIALAREVAPGSISTGQAIGAVVFTANTGEEYGVIACQADGTSASDDYPGRLIFSTTPSGSPTPQTRMTIKEDGRIGMGTTGPIAQLSVQGQEANAELQGISLSNYDYGAGETGQSCSIRGLVRNDGGGQSETGKIVFGKDDDYSEAAKRDGNLQFYTNSSNSLTEKARIDANGYLKVNTSDIVDARFIVREGNSAIWTKLEIKGGSASSYHMAIASGRYITRNTSETSIDLVTSRTTGTNVNQSVRVEFFLNSAVNNDMGVIVGYAGCHKSGGGDYTFWANTPTVTQINGTGYGAGTLTWEGTGNARTLRYTTDSNTNYTKYAIKEMVITGHDAANFEIL